MPSLRPIHLNGACGLGRTLLRQSLRPQPASRRLNSTTQAPPSRTPPPPPPPPGRTPGSTQQHVNPLINDPETLKKGLYRPTGIVFGFFLVGILAGAAYQLNLMRLVPKRSAQRESPAELMALQTMKRKLSTLDIVEELSHSAEWMEIEDGPFGSTTDEGDGTGGISKSRESQPHALVPSTIAGAHLVGPHRVFYNPDKRELIVVLWLGRDLSGWPGMIHGGASGTVLTTVCEWDAALSEQTNGLERRKAAAHPTSAVKALSGLTLTYKNPTYADQFYILRAAPIAPPGQEAPETPPPPPLEAAPKSRNHYVHDPTAKLEVGASLETLEGMPCVLATGVWRDDGPGGAIGESAWRGWLRWWSKKH